MSEQRKAEMLIADFKASYYPEDVATVANMIVLIDALTALRKEMGRAKEALCNIGPQDSHEDIRVWVGTALAALSEEGESND